MRFKSVLVLIMLIVLCALALGQTIAKENLTVTNASDPLAWYNLGNELRLPFSALNPHPYTLIY
jgi:hypothetical protein